MEWIRPLENQKITEMGSKIVLEAEISKENLIPEWLKNGKPILQSLRYELTVEGAVHRLVIKEAEEEDDAEYTLNIKHLTTAANIAVEGRIPWQIS